MWEETLVFTVHMPEITLVRFLVWDHDPIGRDFIGQRTLAFSSMMPGGQRAGRVGRGGVPHNRDQRPLLRQASTMEASIPPQTSVPHRDPPPIHRPVSPVGQLRAPGLIFLLWVGSCHGWA